MEKEYSFTDFIYTNDKYMSPASQTAQQNFFKSLSADLKKASLDPANDKNEIRMLLSVLRQLGY